MTTSEKLARSRDDVEKAKAIYRQTIADANASGYSIRKIAEAVGVSHGTIHTIVRSEREKTPPPATPSAS